MSKKIIHCFDPVIYPIKLYIYIGKDLSFINKYFFTLDGSIIEEKWNKNIALCHYDIVDKKGYNSILLTFNEYHLPIVTHEAVHAALHIWDYLGEKQVGNEANAYLVEWIYKCCVYVHDKYHDKVK
jgi:hypothetical protein